jgi:hypothetical protein
MWLMKTNQARPPTNDPFDLTQNSVQYRDRIVYNGAIESGAGQGEVIIADAGLETIG